MSYEVIKKICCYKITQLFTLFPQGKDGTPGNPGTRGGPGEEGSKTIGSTDKYRFEAGSVFHSWEGRKEYKYGPISQTVYPNHYTSGLLRFVFTNDQDGYVVHTDNNGWKVINLTCAISR